MASNPDQKYPTMIIPRGTEIRVDAQGQLSIKTPGNLVIQNSGSYSEIESSTGSIRIEENVNVEAISVRAAEGCYIQGTLTAWKVEAKKIALEERARANIILQDAPELELAKTARLVGNFGSEKELFLLLSRFGPQMKNLPLLMDAGGGSTAAAAQQRLAARAPLVVDAREDDDDRNAVPSYTDRIAVASPAGTQTVPSMPHVPAIPTSPPLSASPVTPSIPLPHSTPAIPPGQSAAATAATQATAVTRAAEELPEQVAFALVLLDRDVRRATYDAAARETLLELIRLMKNRDLDTLRARYRELFRRVADPSEDARKAGTLVERWASV